MVCLPREIDTFGSFSSLVLVCFQAVHLNKLKNIRTENTLHRRAHTSRFGSQPNVNAVSHRSKVTTLRAKYNRVQLNRIKPRICKRILGCSSGFQEDKIHSLKRSTKVYWKVYWINHHTNTAADLVYLLSKMFMKLCASQELYGLHCYICE